MKKGRILIWVLLLMPQVFWVYARTVDYSYNVKYIKDIQQMWIIQTDNDILLEDEDYTLTLNFDWETIIPKYTDLEQKIIDKIWFERFDELIYQSYINMWTTNYRFVTPGDEWLAAHIKFFPIKIEDKTELKTNSRQSRYIKITSDKDQKVKIRFYSVSPDRYSWWLNSREDMSDPSYDASVDYKTIITLYDTTQEFYNLKWYISNKKELRAKITSSKKYELINFKTVVYQKTPEDNPQEIISPSYIPYYELEFDVTEGINTLDLSYESYLFPNQPIQIK